jgi:hypothetical protein
MPVLDPAAGRRCHARPAPPTKERQIGAWRRDGGIADHIANP